jgi:hypothetical protein
MTDLTATAIVLNWKRTNNLPAILANFGKVPEVKTVIVWNNAPADSPCCGQVKAIANLPKPNWPKIELAGMGSNVCTLGRYIAAMELAKTELILTQDDDWVAHNWSEIIASWTWHPDRVNTSLAPGHLNTMGRRHWKTRTGYAQEVLVGWGSAFSRSLVSEVFAKYDLQASPDQVTYREADRLFTILAEREHVILQRRGVPLVGESNGDALWLQGNHEQFIIDARTRALGLLGVEYQHQGI